MIGYSSISRANVNIYSHTQTTLKFHLNPASLEGDVVTVRAGFFEKAKDGIVSTQTIDIEEIRSDPIGNYDIQMMMHSLPSVITATDQNNEIIVRGGGPGENLFIMDHLEIPNPNHFGEVGSGGGPINILNTEFVDRIDFFAGGFPARYGDKQSSVMDISLREGSYDQFNMNLEMTMAGVGFLTEGPFAHGHFQVHIKLIITSFPQADIHN
jgi:outer membrane receptor for ferrienterochelin and colicin